MKKVFKKLNIAHSPLFRIVCVLCAVATCVLPFAVSASAVVYDTKSIWDLPFTTTVNGNTNTVKVDFPLGVCAWGLFIDGSYYSDSYGTSSAYVPLYSASEYELFFNYDGGALFDAHDIPADTVLSVGTLIEGSSVDIDVPSPGIRVFIGVESFYDNGTNSSQYFSTDGLENNFVNHVVYSEIPFGFTSDTYGFRFTPTVRFKTDSSVPSPGQHGINFELTSVSLSFSVTDLWVQATQNNKLNGVLDEVKTELKNQGTTLNQVLKEQGITNDKLDDVLGEQQETNDKLDNIINGTVDSTLPPDSGVLDDFENQEDQIMDSVNDGFNTALGVLEDTLISIMEVLAGFHAISYIFNLFYGLPLIQLVVNFSLVLGLFGAMLGVANFVGNKFIGKVGGKGKD